MNKDNINTRMGDYKIKENIDANDGETKGLKQKR